MVYTIYTHIYSYRVFTVFSTSKDHKQGGRAMAGCILVDVEKIQVINRSPAYANKYVHRQASLALQNVSKEEVSVSCVVVHVYGVYEC